MKLQNINTSHIFEVSDSVASFYLQNKHIVEYKETKQEVKEEIVEIKVEKTEVVETVKKTKKTTKK